MFDRIGNMWRLLYLTMRSASSYELQPGSHFKTDFARSLVCPNVELGKRSLCFQNVGMRVSQIARQAGLSQERRAQFSTVRNLFKFSLNPTPQPDRTVGRLL